MLRLFLVLLFVFMNSLNTTATAKRLPSQVPPQESQTIKDIRSGDWVVLDMKANLVEPTNQEQKIAGLVKLVLEKNALLPDSRKIKVINLFGVKNNNEAEDLNPSDSALIMPLTKSLNNNYKPLLSVPELRKEYKQASVKPSRIIVVDDQSHLFDNIEKEFKETPSKQAVQILRYSYNLFKDLNSHKLFETVLPDDHISFPESLDHLTFVEHLKGGSGGVSVLRDAAGQKYTLKCDQNVSHMKEEITADALYRSLGVKVPAFAVYDQIPNIRGVACPATGPFRLARFIESGKSDATRLTEEMQKGFVADATLSNWDIVVGSFKNVILDPQGNLWRIDNGGALRYTSLGDPKQHIQSWEPLIVAELQTMRDPKGNVDGAKVYGGIPAEELKRQASDLVAHREAMLKTIDDLDAAIHLENVPELREILRHRIDYLVKTFDIHVPGVRPRIASTQHPVGEKTAAGILVYSHDPATGDPVVLLGKRIRHNWWSNFGGASDQPDQDLNVTAAREVGEESFGLVYYIPSELNKMPSHDILNSIGIKYRMYIAPYKYIPLEEFTKKAADSKYKSNVEYSEFRWVPVRDILNALRFDKFKTVEEGKKTVQIPYDPEGLILYNAFWEMLKEPEVITILKNLVDKKPIGSQHTTQRGMEASSYLSVEEEARQIAEKTVAHGKVMAELKEKGMTAKDTPSLTKLALAKLPYTQSESHLTMEIGKSFVDQHLNDPAELVKQFLTKTSTWSREIHDDFYTNTMADVLKEERKQKDMVVFYHATDPLSSFLFDVYSAFRARLKTLSPDKITVFRGFDTHFRTLNDVDAFIKKFTVEGSIDNANVVEGVAYAEMGLSVNFFLFGSEGVKPSATYFFFYNTESMAPPPFDVIFNAFVRETGIQADIEDYKRLYEYYYKSPKNIYNAKLYQIFVDPTIVDQVAYLSLTAGHLLDIKMPDGSAYHGFRKILDDIRSNLPGFTQRIKKGVNDLQARLFLKPELFHDPDLIKIKSYWRYPIDEKAYNNKLDALTSQSLAKSLQEHSKAQEHAFSEGKTPLQRVHEEVSKAVTGLPYVAKEKFMKPLPLAMEEADYKGMEVILEKMTPEKLNSLTFYNPLDKYDRKEYSIIDLISDKTLQDTHAIELLIQKGLDVRARTNYGVSRLRSTLLEKAASAGYLSTVQLLVKAGVDINEVGNTGTPQATPLKLAAAKGHLDVIQFLLENGADITKDDPLYSAAGNGRLNVVQFLVDKGADINKLVATYVKGNSTYRPPLYIACINGHLDVVRFLVEKGANLAFKDERGDTLLHTAAQEGDLNMVQFFVGKKADVNAKDVSGNTPLHMAALWGKTEVVEFLVNNGADINSKNEEQETPLTKVKDGFPSYFRQALLQGNSKEYYAPRFEAYDKAKPDVIRILEAHGAK